MIKIGETTRHTIDIYQQKKNPKTIPTVIAKKASNYGPRDSELTPLMTAVSEAIIVVKTLGVFSLSSNQPIFFCIILE